MHRVLTIFEMGPSKSNSWSKAGRVHIQTQSNTKPTTQTWYSAGPLQRKGCRREKGFRVKKRRNFPESTIK